MSPLTLLSLLTGASAVGAVGDTLPTSLNLTAVRAIVVQHDGRWPPLDTVARDIVESVTGDETFDGRDPVLWLLAWTFDAETWRAQPLIRIGNAELRGELELPADREVFSFTELVDHGRLRTLFGELRRVEQGSKLNPLQSKVSDIYERLGTLQSVFAGEAIHLIPHPTEPRGAWEPIGGAAMRMGAEVPALRDAWAALGRAFLADDRAAFDGAVRDVVNSSNALPAAYRPSPALTTIELRYNRVAPFTLAWKLMVVGFVLSVVASFGKKRWLDTLTILGVLAGLAVMTYGLWLRWQIAGCIPASNMYESLLFLSWGMGVFCILSLFVFRERLVPLTASGMSAVALLLADVLPVDHFVRPIAPVLLDTVWMAIHVPIIMVSYSVLALAMLIAHAQLVVMTVAPGRTRVASLLDAVHYWYMHVGSILLAVGIITGSMWAASSWGRYWGWDPKEVWSLVALLGYLTILHVRIDHERLPRWAFFVGAILLIAVLAIIIPKLAPLTMGKGLALTAAVGGMAVLVLVRGQFATAVKSVLCFWLVIMTYVGVNYVLGIGLHSYGFGTGAVARYMLLTGGIDLGFVGLCTIIYLWRRRRISTDDSVLGVPAPA